MVLPSVLLYLSDPDSGTDPSTIALGMSILLSFSVLLETLAVGLAIKALLQSRRERLFAFLGLACGSVALLTLVINFFA